MIKNYFVDLINLDKSGMFVWLLLDLFISVFAGSIASGVSGMSKVGIRNTCAGISNILRIIFHVIAIYL